MATENKNLSNYDKNTIPNAKDFRFGIVVSEWNDKITEGLYQGCEAALLDCGAKKENLIRWNVPGSFELVYGAQRMIVTQDVDCIITIGCVTIGCVGFFAGVPINEYEAGSNIEANVEGGVCTIGND